MRTIRKGTLVSSIDTYEAESIEQKLERVITAGEPIDATAPIIYTERKDGVLAEYNIRTDRWDIALDGKTKQQKMQIAKAEGAPKSVNKDEKKGANAVNNTTDEVA